MSNSAETMLLAIALFLAAVELAWPVRAKAMREPTRSLGAALLVLLARQLTDAPRLLVFAIAAYSAAPWWTGIGGFLGSAGTSAMALFARELLGRDSTRRIIRRLLAACALIVAVFVASAARGGV